MVHLVYYSDSLGYESLQDEVAMMMSHRTVRRRAVMLGLAATPVLAACAPQAANPGGPETPSREVNTDVDSLGEVKLKFLDFSGGNDEVYMKAAIKAFEDKHPNVTIERTAQDFDQVMATLNLRLADTDGPDVATINNGWQSMGTLAGAGLILNLDGYSAAYGWNEAVPETLMRQHRFTADGQTMGDGSVWAMPGARLTTTGLYCNIDKLRKLNLEIPTSVAELEDALTIAAAEGEVPLVQGMQEKTYATNPYFTLQAMLGDPNSIADFVYGAGSVKLNETGLLEAATHIQDWAEAGYFNEDASGVDWEGGRASFQKGEGVFHFDYSGSMAEPDVDGTMFVRVQFPEEATGRNVCVGAPAAPLAISARTEHPDAAAAFLDFLSSEEMNQLSVDSGMIPIQFDGLDVPDGDVFATEVSQTQSVAADDGFLPFFDWASPDMLQVVGAKAQLVFSGDSTPEEMIEAGQADYENFHESR